MIIPLTMILVMMKVMMMVKLDPSRFSLHGGVPPTNGALINRFDSGLLVLRTLGSGETPRASVNVFVYNICMFIYIYICI